MVEVHLAREHFRGGRRIARLANRNQIWRSASLDSPCFAWRKSRGHHQRQEETCNNSHDKARLWTHQRTTRSPSFHQLRFKAWFVCHLTIKDPSCQHSRAKLSSSNQFRQNSIYLPNSTLEHQLPNSNISNSFQTSIAPPRQNTKSFQTSWSK